MIQSAYELEINNKSFREIEALYNKSIGIIKHKNRQVSLFVTENSENQLNVMTTQIASQQNQSIETDEIFRTQLLLNNDEISEIYQTIKLLFQEYQKTHSAYYQLQSQQQILQQKLDSQNQKLEIQNQSYDSNLGQRESAKKGSYFMIIENSRKRLQSLKKSHKKIILENIEQVNQSLRETRQQINDLMEKLEQNPFIVKKQRLEKYSQLFHQIMDQIYNQHEEMYQQYEVVKLKMKAIQLSLETKK